MEQRQEIAPTARAALLRAVVVFWKMELTQDEIAKLLDIPPDFVGELLGESGVLQNATSGSQKQEKDNGYEDVKREYNNHSARCQRIAEDVNKWGKNPHGTP